MQNDFLVKLSSQYRKLVPEEKEALLTVIAIDRKIDSGELSEEFTQFQFIETLKEVLEATGREQTFQTERILKELSYYYLTTLRSSGYKTFALTVYAKEFCKQLENEIQSEYDKLSLIHTFKKTLSISEEDIHKIEMLEYWFQAHFEDVSRKRIMAHIERLQRFVDEKVLELKNILQTPKQDAKQLINEFIAVFQNLGAQSEELSKTLQFKEDVISRIKDAERNFIESHEDWEKYNRIQEEILRFFETVDRRLLAINEKIQQSVEKLKLLYENFRHKREYKIRLEKFLHYLLVCSKNDKGEILLPENLAQRNMPFSRFKLIQVPQINFRTAKISEALPAEIDEEDYKLKQALCMDELERHEKTMKWLRKINQDIENNKKIIFGEWFFKILKEEGNIEIPINVGYELVQEFSEGSSLHITDKIFSDKESNLALWKMEIHPTRS